MSFWESTRVQVTSYLETKLEHYLDILQQMVNINSFTENPTGIDTLGKLTGNVFATLGFSTETVPSVHKRYGKHHIYTRRGTTDYTIALVSHLDTVYTEAEEQAHQFSWRREEDRIYGPGTIDIKGGTVMIYALLDAIQHQDRELFEKVTWEIYLDASEEDDARDFGELCLQRFHKKTVACLVFEGGHRNHDQWYLVVARKGRAVFDIEVKGRSAHAGTSHQQGANAIVQLAEVIQSIAALTDYSRQLTVNVGTVRGGTVSNSVPHHAHAKVEMRAFDPEVYTEAKAAILQWNGFSSVQSLDGYPCTVHVHIERETPPWPVNDATESLYHVWELCGQRMGMSTQRQERGGLSDGNLVWQSVPTLDGLGPAGANAHCSQQTADGSKQQEYLQISSFVPKTTLNSIALLELLTQIFAEFRP